MLALQVRKMERSGAERREVVREAREAARCLGEVGVDFEGLVGRGLVGGEGEE